MRTRRREVISLSDLALRWHMSDLNDVRLLATKYCVPRLYREWFVVVDDKPAGDAYYVDCVEAFEAALVASHTAKLVRAAFGRLKKESK